MLDVPGIDRMLHLKVLLCIRITRDLVLSVVAIKCVCACGAGQAVSPAPRYLALLLGQPLCHSTGPLAAWRLALVLVGWIRGADPTHPCDHLFTHAACARR